MRMLVVKPQTPLGKKIGRVNIVELRSKVAASFFSINSATTGLRVYGAWSLDGAIGYCHENLIPIRRIERLKGQK